MIPISYVDNHHLWNRIHSSQGSRFPCELVTWILIHSIDNVSSTYSYFHDVTMPLHTRSSYYHVSLLDLLYTSGTFPSQALECLDFHETTTYIRPSVDWCSPSLFEGGSDISSKFGAVIISSIPFKSDSRDWDYIIFPIFISPFRYVYQFDSSFSLFQSFHYEFSPIIRCFYSHGCSSLYLTGRSCNMTGAYRGT